jgi:uncharacterized OB-fold protein
MSLQAAPLLPVIDDLNRPFFDGARVGELRVQHCPVSGRLIFPPRERSPFAPRVGVPPEWTAVSGRGCIWSFVIAHPPLLPWYAERAPYNVIVVALDEDPGIRMVGNLVVAAGDGSFANDREPIEIGRVVRVVFEHMGDGLHLPRWVRA